MRAIAPGRDRRKGRRHMADAEAIWRRKSDEELLEAVAVISEYTEEGQAIIRAEMKRRRLQEPAPALGVCVRCGTPITEDSMGTECANCGREFPPELVDALRNASEDVSSSAALPVAVSATTGTSVTIAWEAVLCDQPEGVVRRARVPGGWLVSNDTGSLAFVPDADHRW